MGNWKDKLKKTLNLQGSTSSGSSIFGGNTKAFSGQAHRLGSGSETKAAASSQSTDVGKSTGTARVSEVPVQSSSSLRESGSAMHKPPLKADGRDSHVRSTKCEDKPLEKKNAQNALISASVPAEVPRDANIRDAPEELKLAVSQILACEEMHQVNDTVNTLYRLVTNIMKDTESEKYRRIRLGNPKIQKTIVSMPGGMEFLFACGFDIITEDSAGVSTDNKIPNENSSDVASDQPTSFAVLPPTAEISRLEAAARLLEPLTSVERVPTVGSKNPVEEFASPIERETKIILPKSVDSEDLPDWFFERTGAELKHAFLSALRRREENKVFMSQAMREKMQKKNKTAETPKEPEYAIVKVRLPEGLSIQGHFSPREPMPAVFSWVASCLRDPMLTYDLILPDRSVLSRTIETKSQRKSHQSIKQAGFLPSITLLLHWTGHAIQVMKEMPALREELMNEAQ